MFPTTIIAASLLGLASAHFKVDYPHWRADSLTVETLSQWQYPCANASETTSNRTDWSPTGGSVRLEVHHPWALTYVNLGIGTNVSSFNVSLVDNFNQTGNGTFCLKNAGEAAIAAELLRRNMTKESLEGMGGSLQVIQITTTGEALYNCADITFRANSTLLSDDECKNSTNVGGIAIQNAGTSSPSPTGSAASAQSSGAAMRVNAAVSGGVVAGLIGAVVGLL